MPSLLPVQEVAARAGIPDRYVEPYGRHMAKLRLELLDAPPRATPGKLILVTAITPTSHGEGKTVTSIGLAQALVRAGHNAIVTLRQPSLGPVFGLKGGAAGGGLSKVEPSERINLHFTGDFHAITSAHNLLAAMVDSSLHHANGVRLDAANILWPRTMDMNDRALRRVTVGLGGKTNGVTRESGFVITAASEVMAILALAKSREDLRRRLEAIAVGYSVDGHLVRAADLHATGAMMVLLNEALLPNLVQTTENTPAIIHAGPFANIAHGTSSVLAQKMALSCADYVVNECGFAADLGAEKYFDIVMPASGIEPAAAVLVASVRALAEQGMENLGRHIENLKRFGVPVVVAINRFAGDTAEELSSVERYCAGLGATSALSEVYLRGGEGGLDLAAKVVAAAAQGGKARSLYPPETPLADKILRLATEVYGADGIRIEANAAARLDRFTEAGFGHYPICMAKTQMSLSDNPKLRGAPKGWTLTITGANLSAGAGFVVAVAGSMMLMPGLGANPQAAHMDVDASGRITGI